jgi:hypothetical protein
MAHVHAVTLRPSSVQLRTFIVHWQLLAEIEGRTMRYRVLIHGIDVDLLEVRQVLLKSWGYDSLIATPEDVDEKLQSGRFDLVILSLMLGLEEKCQIQAKLPAGTRTVVLRTSAWPEELRHTVADALSGNPAPAKPI